MTPNKGLDGRVDHSKTAGRLAGLALALAVSFPVAWGDPQFQPPSNLPRPQPGKPYQPTPHPRLPVTYYLSCALSDNVIATSMGWHQWTVRNDGHTTAPAGLAFEAWMNSSLHATLTLRRALAPGASDLLGSTISRYDGAARSGDHCAVSIYP